MENPTAPRIPKAYEMMSDTSETSKFVILGVQRSGTTLLRTLLSSHPEILCVGETFKVKPPRGKAYTDEYGLLWYIGNSWARKLRFQLDRRRLTREYLDYLYGLYGYKAIGFKFMLTQQKKFRTTVPYLQHPTIKKIHVIRRNILKTWVSRLTAQARRLHHSDKPVAPIEVHVPTDKLIERLEKIDADNNRLQELFGKDSKYMAVFYEDFVEDKNKGVEEVMDFIGVNDHKVDSPLKKINPDDLSEIVENYDEVKDRLRGTRFEWCLD